MSCNGCRVLRKGCSESCILRPCLQPIESPEAQGHATVFVAKFFGRAGLMSFISAVPENQRPALFQSLLFEACGRTVSPVNGTVGLLWTGNWHVCQSAVETVLRGGALRPMSASPSPSPCEILSSETDDASEVKVAFTDLRKPRAHHPYSRSKVSKRKYSGGDLDLCLTSGFPSKFDASGGRGVSFRPEKLRAATPSMNSEESVTTSFESGFGDHRTRGIGERNVLNLFV